MDLASEIARNVNVALAEDVGNGDLTALRRQLHHTLAGR